MRLFQLTSISTIHYPLSHRTTLIPFPRRLIACWPSHQLGKEWPWLGCANQANSRSFLDGVPIRLCLTSETAMMKCTHERYPLYTFHWRDRVFGNIALHPQQMHCPCATFLTADPATSETERTTDAGSMHHGRIFDNSEENMSPVGDTSRSLQG